MTPVVIDTSVLVAGVFWGSEPHRVVRVWLRGLIIPAISEEIFHEYSRVLAEVKEKQDFSEDIEPWLETMRSSACWVVPAPLGKAVCRDPNDDMFIEAALAAGARTVIARDPDLTTLEKPFGIAMLTLRAWLATLTRPQRRLLN